MTAIRKQIVSLLFLLPLLMAGALLMFQPVHAQSESRNPGQPGTSELKEDWPPRPAGIVAEGGEPTDLQAKSSNTPIPSSCFRGHIIGFETVRFNWDVRVQGCIPGETVISNPVVSDYDEYFPSVDPTSRRMLFTRDMGADQLDIYIVNLDGNQLRQLTTHKAIDTMAVWRPYSSQYLFVSDRSGNPELYLADSDSAELTQLTDDPLVDVYPSFSVDGEKIVWIRSSGVMREIWMMDADGTSPRRIAGPYAYAQHPVLSINGLMLGFDADIDLDGWNEAVRFTLKNGAIEIFRDGVPGVEYFFSSWQINEESSIYGSRLLYQRRMNQWQLVQIDGIGMLDPHAVVDTIFIDTSSMPQGTQTMNPQVTPAVIMPIPTLVLTRTVHFFAATLNPPAFFRIEAGHESTILEPACRLERYIALQDLWDLLFQNATCAQPGQYWMPMQFVNERFRIVYRDGNGRYAPPLEICVEEGCTEFIQFNLVNLIDVRGNPQPNVLLKASDTIEASLLTNYKGQAIFRGMNAIGTYPFVELPVNQPNVIAHTYLAAPPGQYHANWKIEIVRFPSIVAHGDWFEIDQGMDSWASYLEGDNEVERRRLTRSVDVPADVHQPTLGFFFQGGPSLVTVTVTSGVTATTTYTEHMLSSTPNAWIWVDLQPWAGEIVEIEILADHLMALGERIWFYNGVLASWQTPVLEAVSPLTITPGISATLSVTGSNFLSGAVLLANNLPLTTEIVSETQLLATWGADELPGHYQIHVQNLDGSTSRLHTILVGEPLYLPFISRRWVVGDDMPNLAP